MHQGKPSDLHVHEDLKKYRLNCDKRYKEQTLTRTDLNTGQNVTRTDHISDIHKFCRSIR